MATGTSTVFSEYEVRLMNIIIDGTVWPIKCIGKWEESMEVRKTVKKCRGVVAKQRTRGTGSGTGKVTAHMPYECYNALHGMDNESLADGVKGYGTDSVHPVAVITQEVYDEDDVLKLKAYPNCVATTGPARSVENGAEEVAEVELEVGISPDDNGIGVYEALADGLAEGIKIAWMESFTPELVQVATV